MREKLLCGVTIVDMNTNDQGFSGRSGFGIE